MKGEHVTHINGVCVCVSLITFCAIKIRIPKHGIQNFKYILKHKLIMEWKIVSLPEANNFTSYKSSRIVNDFELVAHPLLVRIIIIAHYSMLRVHCAALILLLLFWMQYCLQVNIEWSPIWYEFVTQTFKRIIFLNSNWILLNYSSIQRNNNKYF